MVCSNPSKMQMTKDKENGRFLRIYYLEGQRFGRLTVIRESERKSNKGILWECQCDCGRTTIAEGYRLRRGITRSCGCLRVELLSEHRSSAYRNPEKKRKSPEPHANYGGYTRGNRLYTIWCGIKTRCYNPKARDYKWYGGKGVTMCQEWLHDFAAFREWSLTHGYEPSLTIDRIDNSQSYSPSNCRWATRDEQLHNQHRGKPYLTV